MANIERNRMKLRKDLASELSYESRVVIKSIQEKLDSQAMVIGNEEKEAKAKSDELRRKEDKLRIIHQKLQMIRKGNENDS